MEFQNEDNSAKYIYILKCENDKYYIGRSNDPEQRFINHVNGSGSVWTRKYNPIELFDSFENTSKFLEDDTTKSYMMKYGIENVRGGSYCQIELPDFQIQALEHEFKSVNDHCFNCGDPGHFSNNCTKNKINNILEKLEGGTEMFEFTCYIFAIDKINEFLRYINNSIRAFDVARKHRGKGGDASEELKKCELNKFNEGFRNLCHTLNDFKHFIHNTQSIFFLKPMQVVIDTISDIIPREDIVNLILSTQNISPGLKKELINHCINHFRNKLIEIEEKYGDKETIEKGITKYLQTFNQDKNSS